MLLCVLWVRSYWWIDSIHYDLTIGFYAVGSSNGFVAVIRNVEPTSVFGEDGESDTDKTMNFITKTFGNTTGITGTQGYVTSVVASHWVLVLVCGIVAACPWLLENRFRFSLRTFLIATTLFALAMMVIVGAAKLFLPAFR